MADLARLPDAVNGGGPAPVGCPVSAGGPPREGRYAHLAVGLSPADRHAVPTSGPRSCRFELPVDLRCAGTFSLARARSRRSRVIPAPPRDGIQPATFDHGEEPDCAPRFWHRITPSTRSARLGASPNTQAPAQLSAAPSVNGLYCCFRGSAVIHEPGEAA
jgi:hypothetical protein